MAEEQEKGTTLGTWVTPDATYHRLDFAPRDELPVQFVNGETGRVSQLYFRYNLNAPEKADREVPEIFFGRSVSRIAESRSFLLADVRHPYALTERVARYIKEVTDPKAYSLGTLDESIKWSSFGQGEGVYTWEVEEWGLKQSGDFGRAEVRKESVNAVVDRLTNFRLQLSRATLAGHNETWLHLGFSGEHKAHLRGLPMFVKHAIFRVVDQEEPEMLFVGLADKPDDYMGDKAFVPATMVDQGRFSEDFFDVVNRILDSLKR